MVGDESNRDLVPETDEQRALREEPNPATSTGR